MSIQKHTVTDERQKILNFARVKIFHNGFQKTSIEDIAKELVISKNTIYKYFPSKDKLILEVFKDFLGSVSSEVELIINSKDNAIAKFISLIDMLSKKLMNLSDRLLKDLQLHEPDIWNKIDEMRKQMMVKRIGKLIELGIKEGLFEDYPIDIIRAVFVTSLRSVVNPEFLMHTNISKQQAVHYTFKILLSGCLTKKGFLIFRKLKLPQ